MRRIKAKLRRLLRQSKVKVNFFANELAKLAGKIFIHLGFFREKKLYLILLCLVFITYNGQKLFFQRNKVVLEANFSPDKKLPILTGCIEIKSSFYRDCPERNLEKCEKLRKLFSEIENGTLNVPSRIINEFERIEMKDLIEIRPSDYVYNVTYMNYNHLCLSYKCGKCKRNSTQNLKLINTYRITYHLFVHEERYPIYFSSFMTKQNCKIFSNCTSYHISIEKYEFELLKSPYDSNCIDYTEEYNRRGIFENELVNSKEGCLNICLKEKYRNTFFFYLHLEDDKIKYTDNFSSANAIEEYNLMNWYKACLANCSQPNCYASKYFLRSSSNLPEPNYLTFVLEPSFVSLEGRPYICVFDLWLNIISFICLVLGIDILLLLTAGCNYLARALRVRLRSTRFYWLVKKSIFVTKWSAMMFLFSASLYQSGSMAEDYLSDRNKTHYRIKYPSEMEPFNLHICIPLTQIIKSSPFRNDTRKLLEIYDLPIYDNESFWKEKIWMDNYLRNKKLPELVEETFNLTEVLEETYFEFGLKKSPIQLTDDLSETFFKVHFLRGEWNKVMKCFTVQIGVENPHYFENFFVSARLYIKFKQVAGSLFYITPLNRKLSSEDQIIYSRREVVRREIKYRSKCLKNDDPTNCKSRLRCLDACVLKWVLDQHKEIHLNLLHLGDYQKFSNYSIHLNYQIRPEDVLDCTAKHDQRDCDSVKFDTEKTHFQHTGDPRFKIMQIVFRTVYQTEVEQRRVLDFVLTLLNVYSVLLGVTCQNLMVLLFKLLELKFELSSFKTYLSFALKILYFICCFIVIQFIILNTFNSGLRTSLMIMGSIPLVQFPEINVCFDLNHLVHGNFTNLTGYDLERISAEINYENMFEKIIILDPMNKEIEMTSPFDRKPELLKLRSPFFFLDKKCLRIAYNFSWINDHSTNFRYPIKIKLNQKMHFSFYYYCSNLPGRQTLSQLNRLSFRDAYEVFLDQITYARKDEFEEIKQPQLFFKSIEYKNPEKYIPLLTSEIFNPLGSATLWFPLHRDNFGLTIDNQRFESVYKAYKAENDWFSSQNFNFDFLKERIVLLDGQSNFSLKFNRETLRTKSTMENEESFLSFLVNILNSFCFFFSISTLNVADFVFLYLFKFVSKIQSWFK